MTEEQAYQSILNKVRDIVRYDCTQYKEKCLRRRLTVRMRAHHVTTFEDYLEILERNPNEFQELKRVLTINVSRFFRNKSVFDYIFQHLMPDIMEQKRRSRSRCLRFWSAGCAGGEEPYSLAIMLHQFYPYVFSRYDLSIVGTDIDEESLQRARTGVYDDMAMEEVPAEWIDRYFEGKKQYRLIPTIKEKVTFQILDLVQDAALEPCDLILCRNVMIYFGRELQEKVFNKLANALLPGGYIVLGKTETTIGFHTEPFIKSVNLRERIYQRQDHR
ncbi:MAG: protein-glutamate O-methyltransferase CheR [Gemmatimonadetes bacterium]|nr:MAG: protein-glutamate O-methyltransferase CheR [Gemmatimonadota bacterium]